MSNQLTGEVDSVVQSGKMVYEYSKQTLRHDCDVLFGVFNTDAHDVTVSPGYEKG